MKTKKELCVDSYEGALLAKKYNFDTIELNSALSVGGLTPRISLVKRISSEIDINIICMLRNREAGFLYTNEEYLELLYDLDILLELDIYGIAFGILTKNYEIDVEKVKHIIEKIHSKGKIAVFHRAFDNTLDYKKSLKTLIDLNCDRVLTSGQSKSAIEGIDTIKELINLSNDNIEIVAGAGLNSVNIKDFIKKTNIKSIHASCKGYKEDNTSYLNVSYRVFNNNKYQVTDETEVKNFIASISV